SPLFPYTTLSRSLPVPDVLERHGRGVDRWQNQDQALETELGGGIRPVHGPPRGRQAGLTGGYGEFAGGFPLRVKDTATDFGHVLLVGSWRSDRLLLRLRARTGSSRRGLSRFDRASVAAPAVGLRLLA